MQKVYQCVRFRPTSLATEAARAASSAVRVTTTTTCRVSGPGTCAVADMLAVAWGLVLAAVVQGAPRWLLVGVAATEGLLLTRVRCPGVPAGRMHRVFQPDPLRCAAER